MSKSRASEAINGPTYQVRAIGIVPMFTFEICLGVGSACVQLGTCIRIDLSYWTIRHFQLQFCANAASLFLMFSTNALLHT